MRRVTDDDYNIPATRSELTKYRIDQLYLKISDMEAHIKALEDRAELRDRERNAAEQRNLKWGISTLGAVVATLATIIWSYRSIIFRGLP